MAGVVIADGPYRGLSDDAQSPADNYQAIARFDALIPITLVPARIWPSEAEKRTLIAQTAQELGAESLLQIDTDEALLDAPSGVMCLALQDGSPTSITRRVYPPTATWGPHHARVTDHGHVLWDPEWVSGPDRAWHFRTYHSPADKRFGDAQTAYDQAIRPLVEEEEPHGRDQHP